MAAPTATAGAAPAALEAHHTIPRYLLRLHDEACKPRAGEEAWLSFELECQRYDVPVALSRSDLEALVESSTVILPRDEHRTTHESDWQRWGRWGGETTFRRYGSPWFALLARRRWGRVGAEDLKAEISALRAAAAA